MKGDKTKKCKYCKDTGIFKYQGFSDWCFCVCYNGFRRATEHIEKAEQRLYGFSKLSTLKEVQKALKKELKR